MDIAITSLVAIVEKTEIRELSYAEILLIGAAGGIEEFPVIPR